MTRPTSDDLNNLLAHRAETPTDDDGFDVPTALRRISGDVARIRTRRQAPPAWWVEQSRARLCLDGLARTTAGRSGLARIAVFAADRDLHLADRDSQLLYQGQAPVQDVDREIEGYRIFGCLLHLVGHPVSARFWWQMGAGAGDRLSAHCLYLHHLARGDLDLARLWFERTVHGDADPAAGIPAPTTPDVDQYYRSAPVLLGEGHGAAAPPPGELADEVSRLVAHADDRLDGIVTRPDRRLADRIEEVSGRR